MDPTNNKFIVWAFSSDIYCRYDVGSFIQGVEWRYILKLKVQGLVLYNYHLGFFLMLVGGLFDLELVWAFSQSTTWMLVRAKVQLFILWTFSGSSGSWFVEREEERCIIRSGVGFGHNTVGLFLKVWGLVFREYGVISFYTRACKVILHEDGCSYST